MYRRKGRIKRAFESVIVGLGTAVVLVSVVVFNWTMKLAVTSLTVAAAWNWFGLHDLFHAAPLSFWHVLAIAQVIMILRTVFHHDNTLDFEKNV